MKIAARICVVVLLLNVAAAAACMSIQEAAKKIGQTGCVTGKLVKVGKSRNGTVFLDFCQDYRSCAFTAVVFAGDVAKVGDLQSLEGKTIQVSGKIQEYQGRAEIIIREKDQVKPGE